MLVQVQVQVIWDFIFQWVYIYVGIRLALVVQKALFWVSPHQFAFKFAQIELRQEVKKHGAIQELDNVKMSSDSFSAGIE